jgi:hypothetical protein
MLGSQIVSYLALTIVAVGMVMILAILVKVFYIVMFKIK